MISCHAFSEEIWRMVVSTFRMGVEFFLDDWKLTEQTAPPTNDSDFKTIVELLREITFFVLLLDMSFGSQIFGL